MLVHTKSKLRFFICIALAAGLLGSLLITPARTHAQAGSAWDLIGAVNAYRAASGLEAYGTDGGLMALAQSHAEYQASIETCTHQRADGSGPSAYGISAENIACGQSLSVQDAIYYQWADNLHLATLIGPTAGLVGAGVAESNGTVYYTLAVKRLSGEFVVAAQNDQPADPAAQSEPLQDIPSGMITSTPNSDGSISHIIQYGEALETIANAYGVPLNELISINRLDPNNPSIFAGQALLIRLAYTETPFITSTYTPRPPTRTPLPTRTPRPTRTITPVQSPIPTSTSTQPPLIAIPDIDEIGPARRSLSYAMFGLAALALIGFVMTLVLPGRKE